MNSRGIGLFLTGTGMFIIGGSVALYNPIKNFDLFPEQNSFYHQYSLRVACQDFRDTAPRISSVVCPIVDLYNSLERKLKRGDE